MPCAQQLDQCRAVKAIVESVDSVIKEGNKQRLQNDAHVRGEEEPDGYLVLKARKALVDEHQRFFKATHVDHDTKYED